jgi:hypothetical protein
VSKHVLNTRLRCRSPRKREARMLGGEVTFGTAEGGNGLALSAGARR